jgi:hypothetical protein
MFLLGALALFVALSRKSQMNAPARTFAYLFGVALVLGGFRIVYLVMQHT